MATKKKNSAFMKPVKCSPALTAIVGQESLPRTEIIKKVWEYIKKHNLQDKKNKRNINPDEKLAKVFGSKEPINMFQMTKKISENIE